MNKLKEREGNLVFLHTEEGLTLKKHQLSNSLQGLIY